MRNLLHRTPLRVKLVAGTLALVTAALLVISVASTYALRSYLVGRVDSQLTAAAPQLVRMAHLPGPPDLPTDYLFGTMDANQWYVAYYDPALDRDTQLPALPGESEVQARSGKVFTAVSQSGERWRMLIEPRPNGEYIVVGERLATVDSAVRRLVTAELLVGLGVLILLALLGAAMVRTTLRPLREIEETAGAIAAGDLTQRVPDLEPGGGEPRTEVGRLGRSLNAMLGQIESAFTAREHSELAAREAESRARDSEQRMRQFVADASHELRTPLTSIRGFAELHRHAGATDPDETARLLRRIEDEAARMGLLVEDLLLLAQLDRERPFEPGPVDLRVVAGDAVAAAQAIAPVREIVLELSRDAGPLVVEGDEARLRQVVDNLMSNALTYTPDETPVLLRLRSEGTDALIEVVDRGPGLSPEQADRVFERFYRGDAARTRPESTGPSSGTGLGLAIVSALVAAHGGSVEVDATPGGGTTFRVRLPRIATELVAH